jgi:hypothetical protein
MGKIRKLRGDLGECHTIGITDAELVKVIFPVDGELQGWGNDFSRHARPRECAGVEHIILPLFALDAVCQGVGLGNAVCGEPAARKRFNHIGDPRWKMLHRGVSM